MEELKALILKAKEGNPNFGEPWQVDVFVTALTLSYEGHYSWPSWVEHFSNAIKNMPQEENESANDAYYRQWLSCLEVMLAEENLLQKSEIIIREQKWIMAYLCTPHGSPVELKRADKLGGQPGNHHQHHEHNHEWDNDDHCSVIAVKPLRIFKAGVVVLP